MIYCTADIFTWAKSRAGKRILIMYGSAGETHEFAFDAKHSQPTVSEGAGMRIQRKGSAWFLQWQVTPAAKIVQIAGCDLEIHML